MLFPHISVFQKYACGAPGWLSQLSVRLLILAQVMILRFMGSSPVLGSVLRVQSLEFSLCTFSALSHSFSLSLKNNNNNNNNKLKKNVCVQTHKQTFIRRVQKQLVMVVSGGTGKGKGSEGAGVHQAL